MTTLPTPTRTQLFIAGEFTDGSSSERSEVISPVTGDVIASIPVAGTAELDEAVRRAHEAQREWRKLGVFKRAEICHRVGDLIEPDADELARLTRSSRASRCSRGDADVEDTAQPLPALAEDALRLYGETIPSSGIDKRMFTWRAPIGVWASITPWNFPLMMQPSSSARPSRPATRSSSKPPSNTPLAALARRGLLVRGRRPGRAGASFRRRPLRGPTRLPRGIDAIGFIGSSATAEKIVKAAGLKRSLIEAPATAPRRPRGRRHRRRAEAAVYAAFGMPVRSAAPPSGSSSTPRQGRLRRGRPQAAKRVDSVTRSMKATWARSTTRCVVREDGPHLADARAIGFDILLGGGRAGADTRPTSTTTSRSSTASPRTACSHARSRSVRSSLISGAGDDDTLRIANSDTLGLQSAVFTQSLSKAFRFRRRWRPARSSSTTRTTVRDINMPFGGAGGTAPAGVAIGGLYSCTT